MNAIDVGHQVDLLINGDRCERNAAFRLLFAASNEAVTWSYDVWPTVVRGLTAPDDHVRAICAQLLCNLAAYSDPEGRILTDFDQLLNVSRDPEFDTARSCLRYLWQVGLGGPDRLDLLLAGLELRQRESATEKNVTLVRYDIQIGLVQLYGRRPGHAYEIYETAMRWIDDEKDPDYRKKFLFEWRHLH